MCGECPAEFMGNVCGFVLLLEIIFRILIRCICFPGISAALYAAARMWRSCTFAAGMSSLPPVHVKRELVHMPAVLMRPKAPRAGSPRTAGAHHAGMEAPVISQ